MRYYKAIVKLGHMGAKNYVEVPLFIKAVDLFSARKIASKLPAVKHYSVLSIKVITEEEYISGRKENIYRKTIAMLKGGDVCAESCDIH